MKNQFTLRIYRTNFSLEEYMLLENGDKLPKRDYQDSYGWIQKLEGTPEQAAQKRWEWLTKHCGFTVTEMFSVGNTTFLLVYCNPYPHFWLEQISETETEAEDG